MRTRGARCRALAAAAAVAAVLLACGSPPKRPAETPPITLHLARACDLVPGAGVSWFIEAAPRAIAELPDLIPVIAEVVPEARFRAFARGHGEVDVRQVTDLCVARYRASTLAVARVPVDPARIQASFDERATRIEARTVVVPRPLVVRLSGNVSGQQEHLTVFDREMVATELGPLAALRASEAFARGALKKSLPVSRSPALVGTAALLGEGRLARLLAPGPFEGALADGLGGLLRAATAVGIAVWFEGPPARLGVRVVLSGGWGEDAEAARSRFVSAAHVLSASRTGRLFGLDAPLTDPVVHIAHDALVLDTVVDGAKLAHGLHLALDADVSRLFER